MATKQEPVTKAAGVMIPTPKTVKPSTASETLAGTSTTSSSSDIIKGLTFTPIERFGLIASGVSGMIAAGATWIQGNFKASQLRLNARLLDFNIEAMDRDIENINYVAGIYASDEMVKGAQMKGRQRVAQAESNFDVGETETFAQQLDYTDVLTKDQINEYAYEAALQVEGKRRQIASTKTEQSMLKAEAKYIRNTSHLAAANQFIGGALSTGAGLFL